MEQAAEQSAACEAVSGVLWSARRCGPAGAPPSEVLQALAAFDVRPARVAVFARMLLVRRISPFDTLLQLNSCVCMMHFCHTLLNNCLVHIDLSTEGSSCKSQLHQILMPTLHAHLVCIEKSTSGLCQA